MTAISLALIRVYRVTLGPIFGLVSGCRYTPTCSQYGYEAIQRYGWWRGWGVGFKRIAPRPPVPAGAGGWLVSGSHAATRSMRAAGTRCHDVATRAAGSPSRALGYARRPLASHLADLVDPDWRPDPRRPECDPRRPKRQSAGGIDRAVRHRHHPADDSDQAP